MIKNYLKIAWRNLIKNKINTFINVAGLGVGLACSLLIILWVRDEKGIDNFHANGRQLYQVYERQTSDNKIEATYLTQGLLADELKKRIPEIEYASGMEQHFPHTFEAGNKIIKMDGTYVGADFFRMFSYPLLQGTAANALTTPQSIAISRKMAESFFGSAQKAIGKTIRFDNRGNLLITAVFENTPANSSQQFDFLRGWSAFVQENAWVNNWTSTSPATFVQLRADADPVKVSAKVKDLLRLYQSESNDTRTDLLLQPYSEKYLHSTFKNGQIDGGRIAYVHLFSLVAAFILLIACINFMNLATARSIKRAKEIGVWKVIGANRLALIAQFISEALLLTFISIVFALILIALLLPAFNSLTGKQLFIPINQPSFWIVLVALVAITGLVAGSYPAFFLSSLNPIRVLKSSHVFSSGSTLFRKGLIVFQFTLAIILIVGTMVVYKQMQYIQTKNLGYDRENLLYIPLEGDLIKNYPLFKNEVSIMPSILSVSKMKESPTIIGHSKGDIRWVGKDPSKNVSISDAAVDYDFIKTMKLQLKDGRDFSKEFADSENYLINETAAKKMGYKDPVGMPLWLGDSKGKIVGVLKDFHFNTMYETIEPLVIRLADNQKWGTIIIRIKAGKTKEAITGLEKICKDLNPNFTFSYQFSDQEYTKLYKSEQVVSKLSNYFAFLAIFISCLGLLGLAIFVADQRLKEIGIRKVLGASVSSLFTLLSAEILLLIIIALLVASPVAWFAMNKWLQNFAYRTPIQWWIFAIAGATTVLIALLTVSFQAIKAALANPVNSLRSE